MSSQIKGTHVVCDSRGFAKPADKYNKIIFDLYKYEEEFNKTGNKIDFSVADYLNKLKYNLYYSGFVTPKIKLVSRYTNEIYFLTLSEILNRFVAINKNLNIIEIINIIIGVYYDVPGKIERYNNDINRINSNEGLQLIYSIRNTSLFMYVFQKLFNFDIVKNIKYLKYLKSKCIIYYFNIVSDFFNIYMLQIISNLSDDKLIKDEIIICKQIINNLHILEYKNDIIHIVKHLFYYKHKFMKNKKNTQINFCNSLFKYIQEDLNILNTIDYNDDLKFLQFDNNNANKFIETIESNYTFASLHQAD